MINHHSVILLGQEAIRKRIRELGERITLEMQGLSPCIMPVMDGGMIFAADLMREISLPVTMLPIKASSYGSGTVSSGTVELPWSIPEGIKGKDILLVDDILDTGRTLKVLRSLLLQSGVQSIRSCVLLRKESSSHLNTDYLGFEIPDEFVVGYGLDLGGLHRNLPDIRLLVTTGEIP